MTSFLKILLLFTVSSARAQPSCNTKISETATTLSKQFSNGIVPKVALFRITKFDDSESQFGDQLLTDISGDLSIIAQDKKQFSLVSTEQISSLLKNKSQPSDVGVLKILRKKMQSKYFAQEFCQKKMAAPGLLYRPDMLESIRSCNTNQ